MVLLEVDSITKRFGGLVAVRDLSLTVDQGEILGMIGPNGAGKTTAFNMIAGYYKPNEGRILFNNEEITGLRPDIVCKKGIARTFQLVKPFKEISVLENVMVGAYIDTNNTKVAQRNAEEVLEFLGMSAYADKLAGGLPVGWRKRLEIAKALATKPKMLLLDEAMAGLRPNETEEMIKVVEQIRKQGVAILLVEHVMKVIMSLADRIIVIHHGEMIAIGEPGEVVRNQAVIDAYLGEVNDHAED
ncbi:MAG: ABC transporter ATP-binding protein [Chloroflexota bacterium]